MLHILFNECLYFGFLCSSNWHLRDLWAGDISFESFTNFRKIVRLSRIYSRSCCKRLNWKIIWWGLGKCLYTCWTIFHIRTLRVLEWNDQISAQFATDKVECRAAISTLKTGCRDALLNIYYKRLVEFTLNGKRAWKRYSLDYIFVLYTPSTVSILLCKIKSWKCQRIAYMLLQLSVELGYSLIRQNLLIENNVGMGWRGMSCLLISFCFKYNIIKT